MRETLPIKLKIIERTYPLRIDFSEEEKLRKAALRINNLVARFKEKYDNKDNQDLLAMACLQFASKVVEFEENNKENTIAKHVDAISEDLDEFLKLNQ